MTNVEKMMIERMKRFAEIDTVSVHEMLCDEIGAYVHTVATMRSYAHYFKHDELYHSYDVKYNVAFGVMNDTYFNDTEQCLQYLIENY